MKAPLVIGATQHVRPWLIESFEGRAEREAGSDGALHENIDHLSRRIARCRQDQANRARPVAR